MKSKKTKPLPKVLYINIENPNTADEYFNVTTNQYESAEMGVKREVGVYELKETLIIEGVAKITRK